MSIECVILKPVHEECPYLDGLVALNETLLVHKIDQYDLESLLSRGFRHFGDVFFRPLCPHCRACIPIRIPVQQFVSSKSVKRLFKRGNRFTTALEEPMPTKESFALYKRHKKRFERQDTESYELYVKSFFHPFRFNKVLSIKDGDQLVALAHMDVTGSAMSAIYTYFDEEYRRFSPGKLALYKQVELAREMGIRWLYLGFYVQENRHMRYKIDVKPNQLMVTDHLWRDYLDASGNIVNPLPLPRFQPLFEYVD